MLEVFEGQDGYLRVNDYHCVRVRSICVRGI